MIGHKIGWFDFFLIKLKDHTGLFELHFDAIAEPHEIVKIGTFEECQSEYCALCMKRNASIDQGEYDEKWARDQSMNFKAPALRGEK